MPDRMRLNWESVEARCVRFAPEGSTRRKMLQILSIILLFEGISVLILFSYDTAAVGVISLAVGMLILILFYPTRRLAEKHVEAVVPKEPPPGIKLLDGIMEWIGEPRILVLFGAALIAAVIMYNYRLSSDPKFGDFDTLTFLFGGMLMVYPFARKKYNIEASFCLFFLGLVVLILVVPQTLTAISSRAGNSAGGFYVHYMLAEPFAGILNLLGISASSVGSSVTLVFRDGSANTLSISAYCAGLYSFSIFVSAFISFVLVFERLPKKTTVIVLAAGLVAAYVGNVFRMVIIGVVGYYKGIDALLWTHENVGWMIFLGWSSVFWYLVMRFASRSESKVRSDAH
jgi:archaeosortase C (PEF-CTERM variant)